MIDPKKPKKPPVIQVLEAENIVEISLLYRWVMQKGLWEEFQDFKDRFVSDEQRKAQEN